MQCLLPTVTWWWGIDFGQSNCFQTGLPNTFSARQTCIPAQNSLNWLRVVFKFPYWITQATNRWVTWVLLWLVPPSWRSLQTTFILSLCFLMAVTSFSRIIHLPHWKKIINGLRNMSSRSGLGLQIQISIQLSIFGCAGPTNPIQGGPTFQLLGLVASICC